MKKIRTQGAKRCLVAVMMVAGVLSLAFLRASGAPTTVVSLTFDDALVDQMNALPILDKYGVKGTFYLISGRLGGSINMTASQAQQVQADGHEAAGHTVNHLDLPTLGSSEQQSEICGAHTALQNLGLADHSLAYPFGDADATTEQIAQRCGYTSARGVGGIDCSGCDTAETIPPADPFYIQTPDSIKSSTSLSTIESYVTKAENGGGGWIVLVMHHVCDGCDQYSISPANLDTFLSWLAPRASRGTVVETVGQVMGTMSSPPPTTTTTPGVTTTTSSSTTTTTRPSTTTTMPTTTTTAGTTTTTGATTTTSSTSTTSTTMPTTTTTQPVSHNLLPNPGMESSTNNQPNCWVKGGAGTSTSTLSSTTDAHTGNLAAQLVVTSVGAGSDAKIYLDQHNTACEPLASPGHTYTFSLAYKSDQPVRLVIYYQTSSGSWTWWDQSPWPPYSASATYTSPSVPWTTSPLPSGAVRLSVAVSARQPQTLIVDDLSLVQN